MNKLIYVENYKSWIDQKWIDFLLLNYGDCLPKDFKDAADVSSIEDVIWDEGVRDAFKGWDRTKITCFSFRKHNFLFDINPPIEVKKNFEWFFIKLLSGMGQPIHMDVPPNGRSFLNGKPISDPNVDRYWMPLQDYEAGHGFIYEGQLVTDYKAGDLFKYHNEMAWHAPFNTANRPRLTFNFTTW